MAIREAQSDIRTEEFLLNMGPQHPSTHGVLRVVIRTDGEIVLDAIPHVGYLHRCFEKCCENVSYKQIPPYTDRMDYLAAMCSNVGYSLAAERLLDWEDRISRRVKVVRTLLCELQRIASHLMALGTYGLDLGAITFFLHTFRDRERILDLFEEICGQRLNYSYVTPGGLTYPWPDETINPKIRDFCAYFADRFDEYNQLMTGNGIFQERTVGVGLITAEQALSYGCTGPVIRGSGVRRDIRLDRPYLIYDELYAAKVFQVIVAGEDNGIDWSIGQLGDCWSRYMVRVGELIESRKIVEHCLDLLKDLPREDNDLLKDATRAYSAKKGREAYGVVENPRGELGYYLVSDGKPNPYRVRARGPSFNNLSILREISKGTMVADLVAIIGSVDIVLGEVDR